MNARVLGLLGISFVVVAALSACSNRGFRAVKPESTTFNDQGAPPEPSVLAQSPRIKSAQESAKKEKLQMDDPGGPADADVIWGVSLDAGKEKNTAQARALISIGGQKMMFKGTLSTAVERDGRAVVMADFNVDDSVEDVGKFEKKGGVHYEVQAISHCANQCQDVLVQVQLNDNKKVVASGYYNFRVNEAGGYDIVNSTVDTRYLNVDQALLKAKEVAAAAAAPASTGGASGP